MLKERKDYKSYYTPRGVAIFPSVTEPDYKFKAEGEYHVRLRLAPDAPGLDALIKAADDLIDEAYEAKAEQLRKEKKGALLKELKKAPNPIKPELDPETGDETGFVVLRASMKARIDIKNGPKAGTSFEKKPDLFNAKGKSLHNPPKIGNGSEMKLNVTPMDYFMAKGTEVGVRFELNAAQILVARDSGGERGADYYGFGEEDGDDIVDGEAPQGGFSDESGDDGRDF